MLRNASDYSQEVNIDLIFGYPHTNSEGEVMMKTFSEVPETAPSALEWVRVYPRHLILPPGEQQTIRFYARPPRSLPEGEFWARPRIRSHKVQVNSSEKDNVKAEINLVSSVILALNYRNGKVNTKLDINNISVDVQSERLRLLADIERGGNSAFLGHAFIDVYDSNGDKVISKEKKVAVYRSQLRAFEIDRSAFATGSYRAEITITTEKRRRKNKDVLSAPTVSESIEFVL
jgi:hypothetical protein